MIFNKRMVKTLQNNNQKVMLTLNRTFQEQVCTCREQKNDSVEDWTPCFA